MGTPAAQMAGLGPFRFKGAGRADRARAESATGKADRSGQRLPYLDRVAFTLVASDDAQAIRFQAGEADVASRLTAENFGVLKRAEKTAPYTLVDLGAGLDYSFLFFNLNDLDPAGDTGRRQRWFRDTAFRRAVSLAIDREAIVRLVYRGRATPLWGHVPPGNALWVNRAIRSRRGRWTARAGCCARRGSPLRRRASWWTHGAIRWNSPSSPTRATTSASAWRRSSRRI
jgi:peptide/nickel transport system substrate-binding protein